MKIGSHETPRNRLYPGLVENTRAVYDKFGMDPKGRELIAPLVGHKAVGGAFYYKLRDMGSYGLISGRRTYSVTDLGRRITYPTDRKEEADAIKEAVLRIPLWKHLYDKYGQDLPSEKLWVSLMDFTGVTAKEAQDAVSEVRAAYQDDIRRIPWDLLAEKSDDAEKEGRDEEASRSDVVSFAFEDIRISLPRSNTLQAWDKAKRMMDIYLEADGPDDKANGGATSGRAASQGRPDKEVGKTEGDPMLQPVPGTG